MTAPTFTALIAAYQAADTIAAAIESIQAQTLPAHEIIVVDDGSTDGLSQLVASRFGSAVDLVRLPENAGRSAAMNRGAARATGDFVVLLDADDVWLPRRLEAIAAYAEMDPGCDIITTDSYIRIGGEIAGRYYQPDRVVFAQTDQRMAMLVSDFVFGLPAIRNELWRVSGGMDESMRSGAEDYEFLMRLILTGSRVGLVAEPLCEYRIRSGSQSRNSTRIVSALDTVYEKALAHGLTDDERRVVFQQREHLRFEARMLEMRKAVWAQDQVVARRLAAEILTDPAFRKRYRADALLTLVAPQLARRRLRPDPDEMPAI